MRTILSLAFAAALAAAACGPDGPAPAPYVDAELYHRYDATLGSLTAEAKLTLRDTVAGTDTAYLAPGGVAYLGSNLERTLTGSDFARHRGDVRVGDAAGIDPRFTFQLPGGEVAEVETHLRPFDTLIMGPLPTHNFGFTVYPGDPADVLLDDETLTALFTPADGTPQLATIVGPTAPEAGYVFPRETVGGWPLGQGELVFIRRRTTALAQPGLRGTLTEEMYSAPIKSAVVN